MREVWRVMAPEGRLIVITSNRGGLWSFLGSTPFGNGRPFNRPQLYALLQSTVFEPVAFSYAVHAPPWNWVTRSKMSHVFEKSIGQLFPKLGGVVLVEAVKHVGSIHPRTSVLKTHRKRLKTGTEVQPITHKNVKSSQG